MQHTPFQEYHFSQAIQSDVENHWQLSHHDTSAKGMHTLTHTLVQMNERCLLCSYSDTEM